MTPEELREQMVEALNSARDLTGTPSLDQIHRHDQHQYSAWCYVCRGDVEQLAEAALRVAGVEIQRLQAALGELSARSGRAHAILRGDELPRLSDAARIWEATDALAGVQHTPQPAGPTVRSLGDPE